MSSALRLPSLHLEGEIPKENRFWIPFRLFSYSKGESGGRQEWSIGHPTLSQIRWHENRKEKSIGMFQHNNGSTVSYLKGAKYIFLINCFSIRTLFKNFSQSCMSCAEKITSPKYSNPSCESHPKSSGEPNPIRPTAALNIIEVIGSELKAALNLFPFKCLRSLKADKFAKSSKMRSLGTLKDYSSPHGI